jgi:hypothetical protein
MRLTYTHTNARLFLAVASLVSLLTQPGCNERAPATETEQKVEAQQKRAKSLAGELPGLKLSPRAGKAVRRR